MDSLDDPQAYQTSMVVEKSSKSGIFTNKRLLVIKNGFLYYFSDVPKNYKSHVPNILSTFKDLPKSSIQIKSIQDIRLQSAKSSSLIIKFYEKDMIDKEDLRKSINNKSYSAPQKKDTKQTEQWKFTFPTVLLCRMWLNALMKLKQYFKKQEDHFKSFISNFNSNQKKEGDFNQKQARSNSEIKPLSNTVINTTSIDSNNNHRKTQPLKQSLPIQFLPNQKQQYSQTIKQKEQERQKLQNEQQKKLQKVPSDKKIQQKQKQLIKVESIKKLKQQSSQIIDQIDKNTSIKQKELQKVSIKQSLVTQMKKEPLAVVIQKKEPEIYKKDELGIINQEDQLRIKNIQEQIRNQIEQQIRKQQKRKKEKQFREYQKMLEQKQRKIQNLQTQIRLSKVLAEQRQREIEEQKATLLKKIKLQQQKNQQQKKQISVFQQSQRKFIQQHNFSLSDQQSYSPTQRQTSKTKSKYKQSIAQPQITKCQVNQFSVQTDEQEFYHQNQIQESSQINNIILEKARNSFFSDFSSTYRDTLNLLRTSQNQTFTQKFHNYNYFRAQSTLFINNQKNPSSSQQKLKKEIQLLCYIKHTREKAEKIITEYVEENLPSQNKTFQKDQFFIEIVCSPGKIVNIQGQDKLVYSNKTHQSLKREFKIYQKLQNKIIKCIKKKEGFPLRVPLCVLVQYRGYTALAKILPATLSSSQIKDVTSQSQLNNISRKYMKQVVQSHFINCFQYSQIESIGFQKGDVMILARIHTLFKTKDVQRNTNLFASNKEKSLNTIQNLSFLVNQCRTKSVSLSYQKLLEDFNISTSNKLQSSQNTNSKEQFKKRLNYIKICRQLKKILKSTQPYSGSSKQSSFFKAFLQNPRQISKLIPFDIDQNILISINGQLFYYLELFLGLKLNQKYSQEALDHLNQLEIQCIPLTRSFQLHALISYQHAHRFDKYYEQQKLQSLQNSYKILNSIQPDQTTRNISQAKLFLKHRMVQLAVQKLLQAKRKIGYHDLKKFQLYLLMIQAYISLGKQSDVLKQLRQVLLFIEYMYGQDCTFKLDIYLLMAEALVRMGNLVEAMKMYHLIFKSSQKSKSSQVMDKSLIYLSFSKVLHNNYNADSHQLINFISQFVQKLNSKDTTIKIQTSMHLAQLYQNIGKWDKAKQHYQEALLILVKNCFFDNRFKIAYSNLLNLYQNDQQKENLMNQVLLASSQIVGHNRLIQQSQNQEKLQTLLNTINILHIIQNLSEKDKTIIINLMSKIGSDIKQKAIQDQVKSIKAKKGFIKKQSIFSFLDIKQYMKNLIIMALQINKTEGQNDFEESQKQNQVRKNISYENIKESSPILQNNKLALILQEYASALIGQKRQHKID